MDTAPIREWLRLRDEASAAEDKRKQLVKARDEAERRCMEMMEREGVASVRLDGRTVSLRRELYAHVRVEDREKAIALLDELGLSDLAPRGVNGSSLSAHVREQEKLGIALPEALVELVDVAEVFKLGAVRSTRT